jgi:hypothetical protein
MSALADAERIAVESEGRWAFRMSACPQRGDRRRISAQRIPPTGRDG